MKVDLEKAIEPGAKPYIPDPHIKLRKLFKEDTNIGFPKTPGYAAQAMLMITIANMQAKINYLFDQVGKFEEKAEAAHREAMAAKEAVELMRKIFNTGGPEN